MFFLVKRMNRTGFNHLKMYKCRFYSVAVLVSYYYSWNLILNSNQVNAYKKLDIMNKDPDVWHQRNPRVAIRTDDLECERPNIYVCEEPPNLKPHDKWKTCNYRNIEYHEQIFRWVAGRGCLLFTHDLFFVAGFNNINLNNGCLYGNLFAPCLEIPKADGTCACYPFDPGFEEVSKLVRLALVPSAYGRWERCFYAASNCCSYYMEPVNDVNFTQPDECRTTFDAWTCWLPTKAGTTALEVCSEFAYSHDKPACHHFSRKNCFANASWAIQTDYTSCSISSRLIRRYQFHIAMLSFSLVSSLPALIIFYVYNTLWITKVALHRNTLTSIVVRNVLVIISRNVININAMTNADESRFVSNEFACRMITVMEHIVSNFVFVCILVEGIYLHRFFVVVFQRKFSMSVLYGIGIVVSVVPVVAWATEMAVQNNHYTCWMMFTVPCWAMDVPRILILLINTVLLLDVLRILLYQRASENAHQLSTGKTSLFLLPIFGTPFILMTFKPNINDCTAEQAYLYILYVMEGLQGFFVALVNCYINKEIRMLLKKTYKKTESAVVLCLTRDSTLPRMSMDSQTDQIYGAAIPSQNKTPKNKYATSAPKLHVAEIISIQASEQLSDFPEPSYEIIEFGVVNDGYGSVGEFSLDNDAEFKDPDRNHKRNTYYDFINVSSSSIQCKDWIKYISSPSSSLYDTSLNDYEIKHSERRFQNNRLFQKRIGNSLQELPRNLDYSEIITDAKVVKVNQNDDTNQCVERNDNESEYDNCKDMLEGIMQSIETTDVTQH